MGPRAVGGSNCLRWHCAPPRSTVREGPFAEPAGPDGPPAGTRAAPSPCSLRRPGRGRGRRYRPSLRGRGGGGCQRSAQGALVCVAYRRLRQAAWSIHRHPRCPGRARPPGRSHPLPARSMRPVAAPGTQGHETALRHWARGPWNRDVAAGKHGHSETRPQTDGDQGPVCRALQLVPPPMGGAALPCARPWGRAGRRTWGSQTSFSNWRMHTRGTAGRPPPLRLLHTPWGQGQWDGLGRWAENVRQRSRERRPSSQGCVWPEGPGFWGETTVSPGVGTPHFGL